MSDKRIVRVKICGITNLEDALDSIKAGCDALGFVFYKRSPRYIAPKEAEDIIKQLPKRILKAGVFVHAQEKTIKRIAKLCKLDILQFHGSESPEFCEKFKGYKIIKAFRIKDKIDLEKILRYSSCAYLFDTFVRSKMGGTGKQFNWELVRHLNSLPNPVFLSGGLSARNVRQAIKQAHPDWVDVSTSVEIRAGKKDYKKVKDFIKLAKKIYL